MCFIDTYIKELLEFKLVNTGNFNFILWNILSLRKQKEHITDTQFTVPAT